MQVVNASVPLRGNTVHANTVGILYQIDSQDEDVDIATGDPEFREWMWIEPERLPDLIVPFKRDLYRRLIGEFRPYF